MSDPSRRSFLRTLARSAGIVAVAACVPNAPVLEPEPEVEPTTAPPAPAGPAPLPDGLSRAPFHIHNEMPLALEVKRSAMGAGAITPLSRFFVRNNLPHPSESIIAAADAWSLAIEGVGSPGSITLADLKQLPQHTVAAVLQCSGNGRAFFAHGPSGSPWATGAAGCALWTGVRLADVLARFGGAAAGMNYLTATGGETLPEGVERDTVVVERSIPLDKALDDTLLVWEMNGEPLPITHGGPLRLLVPGYFGVNNIKYVARIAATAEQTTAKIQRKGYRFRPIGESGGPEQPSMWRMPVKSWVNGPGADGQAVLAGDITFYGVAFSGERGIARVEVSLDDGASWQPASFTGPDLGPNAWRTFQYTVRLDAGEHTIWSRATDAAGDTQPAEREENERGYRHSGWRDHGLTVGVLSERPVPTASTEQPAPTEVAAPAPAEPAAPVELSEAGERGKVVFTESAAPTCGTCHHLADAGSVGGVGPDLNVLGPSAEQVTQAVNNGVGAMPAFAGRLTPEQVADVAAYVVEATAKP